jgi:hypothetical protein
MKTKKECVNLLIVSLLLISVNVGFAEEVPSNSNSQVGVSSYTVGTSTNTVNESPKKLPDYQFKSRAEMEREKEKQKKDGASRQIPGTTTGKGTMGQAK